jgi:hypothetical protein
MSNSPAPLLPPDIDLRDVPIPREFFARLAVQEFGVRYEDALDHINKVADELEGRKAAQKRKAGRRRP